MGKGGKSGGKLIIGIAGAAFGYFNPAVFGAATAWAGALYGASLASTLWSVTQKPNEFGYLDSDYSQDDYNRFNVTTNDINQNAVIPVIYGTRKYGGLQVWSNPYNGDRNLEKDVVICEAGIQGIFDVMANEDLITDDTNISIYNIQYKDATVRRGKEHYFTFEDGKLVYKYRKTNELILEAGGKTQTYQLGSVNDNNAQTSLLRSVIENIKADAGNGWKIDGTVDDRTSKGISANTMQFSEIEPVPCYCDPNDPHLDNKVVLDNRGFAIGTYEFNQYVVPKNYIDAGGYPATAWIKSKLIASSRLGGSNPTISATVQGMQVDVYKNGEWVHEYSENPAWIIRDLLLSKRYGTGLWITEDMIDNESFIEVANYCDEIIEYIDADGSVQQTPRYRLNIILDSEKTPLDHLSSMLAVFGGFITFGKQISLKVEKAETPVYDFDDNTIIKDSMSISQTALEDTPNRYRVGYFDPVQNWTEVKVVIEDLELQHEQNNKINVKDVTLVGCTSQNQALRIGRLYRDLNKTCSLTISFSVGTQGMMLECGDVINVSYGGIFSKMPFRITEIKETAEGIYQLTCRQYNASIYNDELGSQITIPNYGSDNPYTDKMPSITGLILKEQTYTSVDGNLNIEILATWNETYYQYFNNYEVLLSTDNINFTNYRNVFDNRVVISGIQTGKYWVGVRIVTNDGIKGNMVISSINVVGKDFLPPDVTILDTDVLFETTRRFYWEFEYPNPNDIAGFRIKYNQGTDITWENGQLLHTGLITQQPFETKALRQGIHTVMIKAVDNGGNESKNVCYTVLNLGDPLEDNVLYKYALRANNWEKVVHNGIIDANGNIVSKSNVMFWNSPNSNFWVTKQSPFWVEKYDEFEFIYQTKAIASGQFWLRYNIEGAAKIYYRVVGKNSFWLTPNTPFWASFDSKFWIDNTSMFKPYTGKVMIKAGDMIQVRVVAPDNISASSIIKNIDFIIDVPDREEHFENLYIPEEGIELDIKTPNYYTTSVRLDSVRIEDNVFKTVVINKNPCKIKLFDINNNSVSGVVDVTWQGFIKELV